MKRPVLLAALLLLLAGCSTATEEHKESGRARWQPRPGVAWQWQLSGRLDTSVDVPVYDIDGFDHEKAAVTALHRKGRKVICYLSTGAWEEFRPDAKRFPKSVLGRGNGWQGSAGWTSAAPMSSNPSWRTASTCAAGRASTPWSPTTWTATATTPASR